MWFLDSNMWFLVLCFVDEDWSEFRRDCFRRFSWGSAHPLQAPYRLLCGLLNRIFGERRLPRHLWRFPNQSSGLSSPYPSQASSLEEDLPTRWRVVGCRHSAVMVKHVRAWLLFQNHGCGFSTTMTGRLSWLWICNIDLVRLWLVFETYNGLIG